MRPPRVIIISPHHWERVELRAELRERGIDAVGARDVPEALIAGRPGPDRAPVSLLVVEHDALGTELDVGMLERISRRLGHPATILIARVTRELPAAEWTMVLPRPVTIGEIAGAVQHLLPDIGADGPLDH